MNNEPVAWIDPKELDMYVSTSVTKNKHFDTDIPLYTHPAKYCPSENNEAYEKGFIDGMAKQRDSAVQRMVEANTHPVKEHDIGISHAIGFDDGFKAGMQRAVEMNVVKELTDEEIWKLWVKHLNDDIIVFARATLRKAQDK